MATGYAPMKVKRKDIDEVNDNFSDFSLSSPARKFRRLDADLPPILEEEELKMPPTYQQSMVNKNADQGVGGIVIEELPALPENEERAIVLFKPKNNPLLQSPPSFSVSVSPNLISGLKTMTSIPSSSSINIRGLLDKSQLTGPNFKSWYRKLRLVLECENLLDIIDQPAPAPPAPEESAEIKAAYSRYFVDRTTVRCIMLSSMTEELGCRYDEDQPDVMIKKLSESYGTSEKAERFSLTRIMFNEKMKDGQSVGEHSRHLISISERLAAFGMVLPKDMVQDLILHSLPLSFKGFITTLNMMDIDHTLDRLIGLLIEYERENGLLKTNTPIVNLVTNVPGSSSSSKRKCSSKKKKKNNPALKEKGKEKVVGPLKKFKADKSKAQCFHCNRIGHWKRNCPIYLDEIKKNKTATTG